MTTEPEQKESLASVQQKEVEVEGNEDNPADARESAVQDLLSLKEQRSTNDLLDLLNDKLLDIEPEFQREFIWDEKKQAKFIDSLLKGLPVPNLTLAKDYRQEKLFIVDGKQRIMTVSHFMRSKSSEGRSYKNLKFLQNSNGQFPNIKDIHESIRGKMIQDIDASKFDKVGRYIFPTTILIFNQKNPDHQKRIYTIFQRLNEEGIKLNPQEIRHGVYGGEFMKSLTTLRNHKDVKKIWKLPRNNRPERFKYEELILRFFAFYDEWQKERFAYPGNLRQFLNDYIMQNQFITSTDIEKKAAVFLSAVQFISAIYASEELKDIKAKIHWEALVIAIAMNLESIRGAGSKNIQILKDNFRQDILGGSQADWGGILKRQAVKKRQEKSIQAFQA